MGNRGISSQRIANGMSDTKPDPEEDQSMRIFLSPVIPRAMEIGKKTHAEYVANNMKITMVG